MCRAYRSPAAWALLLSVITLGLAADIGSKSWAFHNVGPMPITMDMLADHEFAIPFHESQRVVGGVLNFHLVDNHGAVFGIGANHRSFFIAFTIAALAAGLLVFGRMTTANARTAHFAIGLIVAGGIGNLYDRILAGRVRDFLHLFPDVKLPSGWRWPGGSDEAFPWVFNVADMMLLTGMVLLMMHINRMERARRTAAAGAPNAPAPAVEGQPSA
jgi:signal peptidase II